MTRAALARKTIISIARRKQRPGAGSSRELLLSRTTQVEWPDLSGVLQDTLFAVVGAVATRLYAPESATRDLDVVVLADDLKIAEQKMRAANWIRSGESKFGGSSWRSPKGEEVDVLEARESWWKIAVAQAQSNRDGQGLPIVPLPFLALMKFQSGRAIDIGDITCMLGQAVE